MKKTLLLVSLCLIFFISKAKCQSVPDASKFPYWMEMMQYDTVNFFKVQKAFYEYYTAHHDEDQDVGKKDADTKKEGEEEEEGDGFEIYKRWEYLTSRRIQPDGTRIKAGQVNDAFNKYISASSGSTTKAGIKGGVNAPGSNPNGNWKSIGPQNVPTDRVYQVDGMGRVNAIAFSPTAKGTIYIGAPDGGLWVTTDSGASWTTKTDGQASLGVSAIAVNPKAASHIYIGTGDRDNNDATGLGVWKSVNSGTSWSASGTGMGNVVVSKLLIDPKDTTIMLAATSAGIYRSTNAGAKWTKTSSATGFYKDLVFKPHNYNVVYASAGGGFFRSTNNGVSWSQISSGLTSAYRGVITVSANDTNLVYFITTGTNTFSACYISTDGGTNFRTKSTSPNIMGYADNGSSNDGQAFYDLCVIADTAHAGTIYVGGINVFKSTDSGSTWHIVAHWVGTGVPVIHADIHVFAINPLNNRLYAGNDGGIAYTSDTGSSWNDISSGLEISEIYKLGQSASRSDLMLMGCQDNGSAQWNKKTWYSVLGGDGMVCAVDPNDTDYEYTEVYNGQIYRSKDAGQTFYTNIAGKGINGITESGAWVTPYILSNANSKEMYAGYNNLWKCYDLTATTPTWTQLSNNLGSTNTALIQTVEQSPVDSNTIYMSRDDNKLFLSTNVNSSTPSWTDLTPKLPNSNSLVAAVKVHPKYGNAVYIIQNNDVYLSLNSGGSWTKITGSLPNVPKNVILIDKNSYSGLYLGTDAGVYYRDSTMTDWTPFYSGLPVEPRILDLSIYYDPSNSANNFISAGSYGRGVWQSSLFSPVNPVAKFGVNNYAQCLNNNSFSFTDSSTIASGYLSWGWDFGDSKYAYTQNPTHVYAFAGTYTVKLLVTSSLGTTNSITKTVTVYPQATPAFSVNAANQCLSGNAYIFTDKSSSASGTLKWSWDFGDGSSPVLTQNTKYNYSKPGADTVKLTVTTNNGCPATASKTIIIYPQPSDSFNENNPVECLTGNNFSFNNNSSISSGSISKWNWKFGNGDSSVSKSPTYSYKNSGIYKIVLTATSGFGCITKDSQTISVYPQIVPAFSINIADQCLSNNKFIFTDKSTISSGSITSWIWQFGDNDDTSTENPVHIFDSTGSFRVKLYMTTDNGCNDTVSQVVAVYPQPKSAFSVSSYSECLKYNRFSFSDLSVASSGNVILGWTWKFGDSVVSSIENPYLSFKKSGNIPVSLIVSDSNQCTDSSAKTVTILPQIKAVFAVNDSAQCFEDNSFAFRDESILPSGTNFWSWNFGDNAKSITQNPFHSYSNPGTYKVVLVVSNSDGCKDTINKTMIVYPKFAPKLSVNAATQCLNGNNFSFIDSSGVSAGSIVSRLWKFGDGSTSTSQNQNHIYTKSGISHVVLTDKSDKGCYDSISQNMTINLNPAPLINGDSIYCQKGHGFFAVINYPGVSYKWNLSGGNLISATDTTDSISVVWPTAMSSKVMIVETNSSGCMDSDSVHVVVNPVPIAKFGSLNQNSVCAGSGLKFIDSSTSAVKYLWQFGDASIDSVSNPSHTYLTPGKYKARQIVINSFNCFDTTTRMITVNPVPVAHWSADSLQQARITFTAKDTTLTNAAYSWDLGDGTKITGHRFSHVFPSNKQYIIKLTVTSPSGCVNEFDSTLNVTISSVAPENKALANFSLNIYPNPFQNSTHIDYELSSISKVKIGLFDMNGKEITTVTDEQQASGKHKFEMDGNELGLTPGTYILKVYINDAFITKDIIKL